MPKGIYERKIRYKNKVEPKRNNKKQIPCEFCNQYILYHKIERIFKIINVKQQPKVLYFCSKKCRLKFIDNIQKIKIKEF